jgi:hypothetical protein
MRRSLLWMLLAACATPGSCTSAPDGPGDPFAPARAALERRGKVAKFERFEIGEADSSYCAEMLERSQEPVELRAFLFRGFHATDLPDRHAAIEEAMILLARAGEERLFDPWCVEDMVDLARAQRVRLAGEDDVRWFLHADAGLPPIDVEATGTPRRWRFHVGTSGVPDPGIWEALELDEDGVPVRVTRGP